MTSISDQYRIIASRAGWVDRGRRGRVRFSGPDASSFLQGLLTNDVGHLEPGRGVYAAWLTPLGRMIADLYLLNRGHYLLALVGDDLGPALAAKLDALVFAEQVDVADVSSEWADVFVTGGQAPAVVSEATGSPASVLGSLAELDQADLPDGFVVSVGDSSLPAFRILVPASGRADLVSALERAGAVQVGDDLAAALRIEAGRGEWGRDLSDDVIPLEAGLLDRAISTSKGCYVGQEIVIRILHRGGGRVARRLVTIEFDETTDVVPPDGTPLELDGRPVGHVTSAAWSPARSRVIALGYVQRDGADIGRQVVADGRLATVTGHAQ